MYCTPTWFEKPKSNKKLESNKQQDNGDGIPKHVKEAGAELAAEVGVNILGRIIENLTD